MRRYSRSVLYFEMCVTFLPLGLQLDKWFLFNFTWLKDEHTTYSLSRETLEKSIRMQRYALIDEASEFHFLTRAAGIAKLNGKLPTSRPESSTEVMNSQEGGSIRRLICSNFVDVRSHLLKVGNCNSDSHRAKSDLEKSSTDFVRSSYLKSTSS